MVCFAPSPALFHFQHAQISTPPPCRRPSRATRDGRQEERRKDSRRRREKSPGAPGSLRREPRKRRLVCRGARLFARTPPTGHHALRGHSRRRGGVRWRTRQPPSDDVGTQGRQAPAPRPDARDIRRQHASHLARRGGQLRKSHHRRPENREPRQRRPPLHGESHRTVQRRHPGFEPFDRQQNAFRPRQFQTRALLCGHPPHLSHQHRGDYRENLPLEARQLAARRCRNRSGDAETQHLFRTPAARADAEPHFRSARGLFHRIIRGICRPPATCEASAGDCALAPGAPRRRHGQISPRRTG